MLQTIETRQQEECHINQYGMSDSSISWSIKTLPVLIPAGKTEQVNIELTPSSFEFFDLSRRKIMITPGKYEVFYGNISDSKDLKK